MQTKREFYLNNQPDALIIPILFCYKTLQDVKLGLSQTKSNVKYKLL